MHSFATPGDPARPQIVLVEDDILSARMVIKILNAHGYDVTHAVTGLEGIQYTQLLRPNLVLVDLGLPDLDGKVVATQLQKAVEPAAGIVCAFTNETGAKAKRLALAYGCQFFISKPIDSRAFPGQIADLLNRALAK
jgi:DNA-binding response OmpR family regulator